MEGVTTVLDTLWEAWGIPRQTLLNDRTRFMMRAWHTGVCGMVFDMGLKFTGKHLLRCSNIDDKCNFSFVYIAVLLS